MPPSITAQNKTLKLAQYESRAVLSITEFSPGTYQYPVQIGGNGLLSTLFVGAIESGTVVGARYWDYSTGLEEGEQTEIGVHPLVNAPQTTNRIFITGSTGKMVLELTVSGGIAAVGVYVSVLTSIATDTGQALVTDGELENPDDRGVVIAGYDETDGRFYFVRTNKGVLEIAPAPAGFPKYAYGELETGSLGSYADIPGASIPLTPGKTYGEFQGLFASMQPADFQLVWQNDATSSTLARVMTGFGQYTTPASLASISFTAGSSGTQRVFVRAKNTELQSPIAATICCVEGR